MKKILVLLFALFVGVGVAQADTYIIDNLNMKNFWEKSGKDVEKIQSIYNQVMLSNKINKRVPLALKRDSNTINADANLFYKNVNVYSGILPYIDNDDEMAYVLSHEIAHAIEAYGSIFKITSMALNSQKYENQADLRGVDYMVKAGYNPIAAITFMNKVSTEPHFDWGIIFTHPKGSKRLLSMYKYIYVKYPQYLNSDMTSSPYYLNFAYTMDKEIKNFQNEQKKRMSKNREIEL